MTTQEVTGVIMDQNNNFTGETIKIKVDQIISYPCSGKCGDSYAICQLQKKTCQDWICSKADDRNCIAGLTRVKKGDVVPLCYLCNSTLILYDN